MPLKLSHKDLLVVQAVRKAYQPTDYKKMTFPQEMPAKLLLLDIENKIKLIYLKTTNFVLINQSFQHLLIVLNTYSCSSPSL